MVRYKLWCFNTSTKVTCSCVKIVCTSLHSTFACVCRTGSIRLLPLSVGIVVLLPPTLLLMLSLSPVAAAGAN
jgi:hypothetical protein